MYYIRKYSDCWAIYDDDTGASRPLTEDEAETVKEEFPCLADDKIRTVFADTVESIDLNL